MFNHTRKILIAIIAGALFSVASCDDDGGISPEGKDTGTVVQDTVPDFPPTSDTTVVVTPPSENPPVATDSSFIFSQADLDLIAALKALIPSDITSGFEERYSAWEETWSRPVGAGSRIRDYAQSEEYNNLRDYCKQYGKASWPLFINKFAREGVVFIGNLLEDLTYTGEERLETKLIAKYLINIEPGKHLPSSNELLIEYSKDLLAQEEAHIRQAILELSTTK
ncbi:MAG: hypothetical protein LBB85_06440 [Dysgonamonadaceae bacterium]|jgi:hypothetical protein|nr:hypothetical protein [Dysgonamonadaceae bacterium]